MRYFIYFCGMKKNFPVTTTTFETPCGLLLLGAEDGKLCLCTWLNEAKKEQLDAVQNEKSADASNLAVLVEACRQLGEYFNGKQRDFQLPLLMRGTAFQQDAWRAMQTIRYGETISYAEEARRAGHPTALRAIGNANHQNPLAVIVPCHRVVASNGGLGGYGGGLSRKRFLLQLEGVANYEGYL